MNNARAIPNAKETMGDALMQPIFAAGFGKLMSDYYFFLKCLNTEGTVGKRWLLNGSVVVKLHVNLNLKELKCMLKYN